ncbi:hypothetical protein FACS1894199_02090 [Bacteroidia bacterium]|nr:hypothetical protein FACS1894199_02090 [Bacteroidia bacterium]
MGGVFPKQYLIIAGKTVLEHSVTVFQNNYLIDEIAIVAEATYHNDIEESIKKHHFTKVKHIIEGGRDRSDSSLAALRLYQGEDCNVLIHDAARPLVSARIINEVVKALKTYHAVNVVIPVTDTIIRTDATQLFQSEPLARSMLYMVQTPQGFYVKTLKEAFDVALKDVRFKVTDDCSIVSKYLPDEKIKMVAGDVSNIKLTQPQDIEMVELLLKKRAL